MILRQMSNCSVVKPAALQCAEHARVDRLAVMEGLCRQACSAAKPATCLAEVCIDPFFRPVSATKKITYLHRRLEGCEINREIISFRSCVRARVVDVRRKWTQSDVAGFSLFPFSPARGVPFGSSRFSLFLSGNNSTSSVVKVLFRLVTVTKNNHMFWGRHYLGFTFTLAVRVFAHPGHPRNPYM